MKGKIFPRNLTARAAHPVTGNPASSRMESAVGNCFPGLEFDIRALDRRFFPGLVFNFQSVIGSPPAGRQGAELLYVDLSTETMLSGESQEDWVKELLAAFGGDAGSALAAGTWYLHFVEQAGRRIDMYEYVGYQDATYPVPYEGETVWWFIRMLKADQPVTIGLTQRENGVPTGSVVQLTGYRRRYTGDTGVFDVVYQPGEMTAAMCSPWTHDFRDCTCHYWASNHPDVILAPAEGERIPDGTTTAIEATTFVDWERKDDTASGNAGAASTIDAARPFRFDPYEINTQWHHLDFVVENKQVDGAYQPHPVETGEPLQSLTTVVEKLEGKLAPTELTLMIEYLYALFSLQDPDRVDTSTWPTLPDDLRFARQFLTLVAVGEMMHLRWANQLLWELDSLGEYPSGKHYRPVVELAKSVPQGASGTTIIERKPELRALTLDVLREFVFVERPGGIVDHGYADVVASLEEHDATQPLAEIATRIDTDGMQHYQRFRDMLRVLSAYEDGSQTPPYLRNLRTGNRNDTGLALRTFDEIIVEVRASFAASAAGNPSRAEARVKRSRTLMRTLLAEGERLAASGIGIPFLEASTLSG